MKNFRSGGFRSDRGGRSPRFGSDRGFQRERGPREMHQAICSKCMAECQVPFVPTGEKPVYCKNCFQPDASKSRERFSNRSERSFDSSRENRRSFDAGMNKEELEARLLEINNKLDAVLLLLQSE